MESLERLRGLHTDLVAFTEKKLQSIDRLLSELETTLDDFRRLLDTSQPTAQEKDAYSKGKVILQRDQDSQEFEVNDEFKHISTALATAIDLNEVEVAKLLVRDYDDAVAPNLTFIAKVVADYEDGRDLLLQCLRLVLQHGEDMDLDEDLRDIFQRLVKDLLQTQKSPNNGSIFIVKCLTTLQSLEQKYTSVTNRLQNKETVGQLAGPEYDEILEFQKGSIFKQHEALSCVVAYLFRGGYSDQGDLHKMAETTRRWQKVDILLVHYLPAFSAAFRQYGSSETSLSIVQVKALNSVFGEIPKADRLATQLDPFLAVLRIWWSVEYSGLHASSHELEADSKTCPDQLKHGLKEHGLKFLLGACSSITTNEWRHPARQEMVLFLMRDFSDSGLDGEQTSDYFQTMFMQAIEHFVESFISNMPDSIRQLKHEEDDLRLEQIAALQAGGQPDPKFDRALPLHLEAFMVIISFAFEGRPEACEQWWEDNETNLYGFLQWASKRQTVPRVSAFCDMLCSIAEGAENASAAHDFLMEDSVPSSLTRSRRVPSMNYAQIFAELELYAYKVHERTATSTLASRQVLETDMNESESPIMLSSYLRLLAHLCRLSEKTRHFVYTHPTIHVTRTLLLLGSGPIPSFLRASIFATLEAMLTNKSWDRGSIMWAHVDEWASNSVEIVKASLAKTEPIALPTVSSLQTSLSSLATSIDQYDAFVGLLRALLVPVASDGNPTFSQDLGSTYRTPGVTPYIDFICGQIFTKRLPEAEGLQAVLDTFRCLDAMFVVLSSFDETQAAILTRGLAKNASTEIIAYLQRHPFARVMQWVLSTEMDKPLMRIFETTPQTVASAASESPLVQTIRRTIDLLNLALDLQATFLDVVKPVLKDSSYDRGLSSQITIEEHVLMHPKLILDLCQYAASEHLELSLRALSLLQKLSSSAKLNNHFLSQNALHNRSRRIVDLLGPNASGTLSTTSRLMATRLQIDERELEAGPDAPGYLYKDGLIAFFNACLETQPELANIAHMLLGCRRLGEHLVLDDDPQSTSSLIDSVIVLVRDYPHGDQVGFVPWLVHIKAAGMQILRQLWTSTVSSELMFSQLRRYQFLKDLISGQEGISESTLWEGRQLSHPGFWFTPSANAITELLILRSALYEYTCKEIRDAASQNLSSVLKQHLQTLLESNMAGTPLGHANVFDLADFLELDLSFSIDMPGTESLAKFNLVAFRTQGPDDASNMYDIDLAKETLQRDNMALLKPSSSGLPVSQIDPAQVEHEIHAIGAHLEANNRLSLAQRAWRGALRSYTDMVVALIECCSMDASAKTSFILQTLQLILPKLDALVAMESQDTLELARIADSLLFALSTINKFDLVENTTGSTTSKNDQGRLKQERMDSIITEKLFQLFRASIDGILLTSGAPSQRAVLYSICIQYLNRILTVGAADNDTNRKARLNSMDCVRSSNTRLVNVLSDDAEDGDTSRLNALNLLALLTSLARMEKSSHVLDALVKANVLEIIIEPIKYIAGDFQDTEPSLRHHLLHLHEARMLLLLQISRTRAGATSILDAGFMSAIRDSLLFRADPDLGFSLPATANGTNIALDNSNLKTGAQQRNANMLASINAATAAASVNNQALQNYYTLLAPTLRVLVSLFTSRGAQNEQAVYLVRSFLSDYRANMVGVFKKYRGVSGKVDGRSERVLGEVVRGYVGLCAFAGWVESEEEADLGAGGSGEGMEGVQQGPDGNGGFVGSVGVKRGYAFS